MAMVASVHLADVPLSQSLPILRGAPKPGSIPGLRQAQVATAAKLGGSLLPKPTPGRVALVAFWDNAEAAESFAADHPLAQRFAGGFHARLEPIRAWGSWPGLATDIPNDRATGYDGPAAVLTMGWLRVSQALRFFKASAKAEESALHAPGIVWATGLGRPPFVSTFTLWESTRALATYAYGSKDHGHPDAMDEQKQKDFHKRSAFIRFRPLHVEGSLQGKNPLAEHAISVPA
jgi:hypothetical protein